MHFRVAQLELPEEEVVLPTQPTEGTAVLKNIILVEFPLRDIGQSGGLLGGLIHSAPYLR